MPKKSITTHGTVEAFNISPKGSYEGLLLRNQEELIQVNFPPEWSTAIADLAGLGSKIQLEAEPEKPEPHAAHSVYRLVRAASGDKHWPNSSDKEDDTAFSGTIQRLNYALHGEVNGALLDNGDFLHTKPHGASALKLSPGMKVKGTGRVKPAVGPHRVIDAIEVNGIELPKPKKAHH